MIGMHLFILVTCVVLGTSAARTWQFVNGTWQFLDGPNPAVLPVWNLTWPTFVLPNVQPLPAIPSLPALPAFPDPTTFKFPTFNISTWSFNALVNADNATAQPDGNDTGVNNPALNVFTNSSRVPKAIP